MDHKLQDRSAKVLVVEGSGATRTLISEVVKKSGFTDVTGVPSIKDALGVMEAEDVDWIISSVLADQPENGVHLVKLVTEIPQLKTTRVSFLLDEDEQKVLPYCFRFGLLSYHRKPFTKDSLIAELEGLVQAYEDSAYNSTLTAGTYLRKFLNDEKKDKDLLQLERSLIGLYPSDYELLFNLIPPLSRLDRKDEAKSILGQILVIDPEKQETVDKMRNDYLDGVEIGNSEGDEKYNFLGLEKVVIVEPDEAVSENMKEILGDVGVTDVSIFKDGEEAAAHVNENPDPGIVLMEWRVPSLPGPLLVQRLKSEGAETCPIVVVSSLLEAEDIPLVREMGVATCIDKPLDKSDFIKKLIWTIQQDRNPSEQATMERKMRDFLKSNEMDEALAIKANFMAMPDVSDGAKEAIEAEFAYVQKRYADARNHGIEALTLCGDSLFMLNLLGKSLVQLREFEVALKCFKKAQQLSPRNIERLCAISEVQSEMGDHDAANETLKEAQEIDPDNTATAETAAKITVNAGDTARAKEMLSKLNAIDNVISFMNNSAVALAKCNMVDQGIEQYRKTMKSIPDNQEGTKAIVMYNLALAHARADEFEEACLHLERVTKMDSRVKDKSSKLLKRIKKAMETGTSLAFAGKPTAAAGTADGNPGGGADANGAANSEKADELPEVDYEMMAAVDTKPGDNACFLIYFPEDVPNDVEKLAQDPPRFKIRTAIEREQNIPSAS